MIDLLIAVVVTAVTSAFAIGSLLSSDIVKRAHVDMKEIKGEQT